MFDDEFLYSLPDDPDEALAVLYKALNDEIIKFSNEAESFNQHFDRQESQRALLSKLFAFIDAHHIDLTLDRQLPGNPESFASYYREAASDIEYYIAKTSFERAARLKNGASAIYVLTPALKMEIHHYITQIRDLIAGVELSDTKRAALVSKLNAFATEVDRDKTRIESLAAAIIWTRREVVTGAKGLEPIIEKLERTFNAFAKATDWARLPSPGDKKQLPSPPKRIENRREPDDEVPF
jgi:hypothetical protein